MRVLWLCNIMLPEIANNLGLPSVSTGGWLSGLANGLKKNYPEIELTVSFPNIYGTNIDGSVNNLHYYGFGFSNAKSNYKNECEEYFNNILKKINPDVIHIFGTEYPHSLAMVNVCEKMQIIDRVVINIQGMVSVYSKHYMADLPWKHTYIATLRDLIKKECIYQTSKKFEKKGKFEIEAIKKCKNIIGRTDWDRACTYQINDKAKYYHCNEILRDSFYGKKWNVNTCDKHTIFVSQCYNPIKGFHKIVEALELIVKHYPDTQLYTTGRNIIECSKIDRIKLPHYSNYLAKIIKEKKLENNIHFLGDLNEEEMCKQYLKSNVFVSASSIENSPNSVGEAMLLGVPVVSTDVGGVKNMLNHDEEGYIYPFNEYYMLAYYVEKVFSDTKKTMEMSEKAQKHAMETHNSFKNTNDMVEIYEDIIKNNKRKIYEND